MEKQILVSESHQKYADKYTRGNHIIGASMWEFEWRSKYRYKMFRKWKYRKLVEACIRKATCEHKIKCIELNVRPDNNSGNCCNSYDDVPIESIATVERKASFFIFHVS